MKEPIFQAEIPRLAHYLKICVCTYYLVLQDLSYTKIPLQSIILNHISYLDNHIGNSK